MSDVITATALKRGLTNGTCPKCRGTGLRHAPGPAGDVFHCPKCRALPANEAVGYSIGRWPAKTELDRFSIRKEMERCNLRWEPKGDAPPATRQDDFEGRLTPEQVTEILNLARPWDTAAKDDIEALTSSGIERGHAAFYYIPKNRRSPDWFRPVNQETGKSWDLIAWGNYRLVCPAYDADGQPRGLKLRPLAGRRENLPKSYSVRSKLNGLILACDRVVAALHGIQPWPAWVLILEGEKDHAAAIARWSHVHPDVGFIGIFQGSISADWMSKIPEATEIVSMVDLDQAGEHYHQKLEQFQGLQAHRNRPIIRYPLSLWAAGRNLKNYDPKKPPDVADYCKEKWAPATLELSDLLSQPNQQVDGHKLLRLTLDDDRNRNLIYDPTSDALFYCGKPDAKSPSHELVCGPVPQIEAQARDIQTGETAISLAWDDPKTKKRERHLFHGSVLADPRALAKALSAQNINVNPAHQTTVAYWCSAQRFAGREIIPLVLSARANGWWNISAKDRHADGAGFLLGGRWCGRGERVYEDTSGHNRASARIRAALEPTAAGSFSGWCHGMSRLRAYPVPQIHVLTNLASPLLPRVGAGALLMGNIFPRGSAKTLALQIGLSTYARPDREDGALQGWKVSDPGLEQALNYLRHLTICLDDTSLIKTIGPPGSEAAERAKRIAEMAYFIVNGTERLLSGTASGAPGGWRMMAAFTAEDRPDFRGQQEGAEKRFVAITCHPWQRIATQQDPHPAPLGPDADLPNDLLVDVWQTATTHAGHVMPTFIEEILRHPTTGLRARWAELAGSYRSTLRGKVKFVDTLAEIAAVLKLTQELFENACGIARVPCPLHPDVIEWLLRHLMGQFHADGVDNHVSDMATQFVQWAQSMRLSGALVVMGSGPHAKPMELKGKSFGKTLGKWETDAAEDPADLFVLPAFIDLFLKEIPSPRRRDDLIRAWIDLGLIEPHASWTPQLPLRRAQHSERVPNLGAIYLYKIPAKNFRTK